MDIVINELSLDGQFEYGDFIKYMEDDLVPILNIAYEKKMLLFKKSDIFSHKITHDKVLYDFMFIKGEPSITKFKSQLISLNKDEPFWDLNPTTDIRCEYCSEDYSAIPNGITEAYARDSLLVSFKNTRFLNQVVRFNKDDIACEVINFCSFHKLQSYLQQIGIIEYWFKNSFELDLGYFFEIRFNEGNHNKAHFHVEKADYSGSYSIPEFDKLAGNIPNNDEKEILSWAQKNLCHIVEMWNRLHPNLKV